jgi:two-component system sensor histidine kinase MprB
MSFRSRMVLLAASAVAAAVVFASVVVYVVTGDELRGQIDSSLHNELVPGPHAVQVKTEKLSPSQLAKLEREAPLARRTGIHAKESKQLGGGFSTDSVEAAGPAPGTVLLRGSEAVRISGTDAGSSASSGSASSSSSSSSASGVVGAAPAPDGNLKFLGVVRQFHDGNAAAVRIVLPSLGFGGATGYAQLVQAGERVLGSGGSGEGLPVTAATRAVAAGRRPAFYSDATLNGTKMRVLTAPAAKDTVWQIALPLTDVNSTLDHLRLVLAAVILGGALLAAALGLLVSRAALVPVRRLTGAAERVARTQDLGHRIRADEGDELGRLARSFNTMLAALERSRLSQRQLVSDASHELRTPLTSVQANLDALALGDALSPQERARAVASAQAQLRELTVLVGDMVDLSKTDVEEIEVEDVRLDLAAAEAVERARLHAPECAFSLDVEPCMVRAAPARLDRAIANLLDNACKWNPTSPPWNPPSPPYPPSPPCGPPSPPAGRAGGPIEVRVRDGRLEVRDHGPGIDAEDLPRVFDRFFRAPAARGRPGSGLGLAIVRQTAETHGGAVHAVNDPGGGARLILELPSLAMTASELAASRADEPPVAGAVQQVPRLR